MLELRCWSGCTRFRICLFSNLFVDFFAATSGRCRVVVHETVEGVVLVGRFLDGPDAARPRPEVSIFLPKFFQIVLVAYFLICWDFLTRNVTSRIVAVFEAVSS